MAYSKEFESYIQLLQDYKQTKGNIKIAIRCSGKNNFFSVYRPVDLSIEQTYTGRMRLEFKEADGTMKDVFFDEVVNIMHDYWVGITEDNTYDMVFHKEDHPPQPMQSFKNLTENDKAYLKEKGITMKEQLPTTEEFKKEVEKIANEYFSEPSPENKESTKNIRKPIELVFEEIIRNFYRKNHSDKANPFDLQDFVDVVDQVMDAVGEGQQPKMILQCKGLPIQTFQVQNIECVNTKHEEAATALWLTTPDGGLHQWNLTNVRQTMALNFKAQTEDAEVIITFLSS